MKWNKVAFGAHSSQMDLKRSRTVAFEGAHLVPEPSTILLLALATQELAGQTGAVHGERFTKITQ
jgi:hypothetical protein